MAGKADGGLGCVGEGDRVRDSVAGHYRCDYRSGPNGSDGARERSERAKDETVRTVI